MAYLDLVAELAGTLPGLSPLLAQKYVNRAWQQIRAERLWSFLIVDGVVICPAQITAGTAAIVQYASTATLDTVASAALLAQATPGATPGLTNMVIRFGATSPAASQIYNIVAANITVPTAIVLTLDRPVVETTNALSAIQVYRPYITPPVDDFLKWESLVDMTNGMTLAGDRLNKSSRYFDLRDPQRAAQGMAYFCGNYMGAYDPSGTGAVIPNPNVNPGSNVYELWPHPTAGQVFYCRFRRKGIDFVSATDSQPSIIPDSLIIQRALGWHAYPFAAANVANFPTFKGVNWTQLIAASMATYRDELTDAKRQDEEAAPQLVWNRGHGLRTSLDGGFPFPIDSNWLQGHLINF